MHIERPAVKRGELVYQYPGQGFPVGTTVLLEEGEAAVFVRWGRLLGSIQKPGRHALSVDMVPFLKPAQDAFGAFTAETYFVTTLPFSGIRFRGRGLPITDSQGQAGTPRFAGSFTLKVADPERFVQQLLAPDASAESLQEICRLAILRELGACTAAWVQRGHFSLDQLPDIDPLLAREIPPHASREAAVYGLRVLGIDQLAVAVPEL